MLLRLPAGRRLAALVRSDSDVADGLRRNWWGGRGRRSGSASDLVELRCQAPPALAAARLGQRGTGDLSDATPAIAAAMAADLDAWAAASPIDTGQDTEAALRQALGALQAR